MSFYSTSDTELQPSPDFRSPDVILGAIREKLWSSAWPADYMEEIAGFEGMEYSIDIDILELFEEFLVSGIANNAVLSDDLAEVDAAMDRVIALDHKHDLLSMTDKLRLVQQYTRLFLIKRRLEVKKLV